MKEILNPDEDLSIKNAKLTDVQFEKVLADFRSSVHSFSETQYEQSARSGAFSGSFSKSAQRAVSRGMVWAMPTMRWALAASLTVAVVGSIPVYQHLHSNAVTGTVHSPAVNSTSASSEFSNLGSGNALAANGLHRQTAVASAAGTAIAAVSGGHSLNTSKAAEMSEKSANRSVSSVGNSSSSVDESLLSSIDSEVAQDFPQAMQPLALNTDSGSADSETY